MLALLVRRLSIAGFSPGRSRGPGMAAPPLPAVNAGACAHHLSLEGAELRALLGPELIHARKGLWLPGFQGMPVVEIAQRPVAGIGRRVASARAKVDFEAEK